MVDQVTPKQIEVVSITITKIRDKAHVASKFMIRTVDRKGTFLVDGEIEHQDVLSMRAATALLARVEEGLERSFFGKEEVKGSGIQPRKGKSTSNDLWIGATCLRHGVPLIVACSI